MKQRKAIRAYSIRLNKEDLRKIFGGKFLYFQSKRTTPFSSYAIVMYAGRYFKGKIWVSELRKEWKYMKNYLKDFSIEDSSLVNSCNELEMVIANRQDRFSTTEEYKKSYDKIHGFIGELLKLLPENRKTILGLEETIETLEGICYSAAYRDGMSDLMATMTFNRLGITMAEYCGPSSKEA